MDRLRQLADDLTRTLDELQCEAARRDARPLMAPLAWLDEANAWLRYELRRVTCEDAAHGAAHGAARDVVPFTYIPVELRKGR